MTFFNDIKENFDLAFYKTFKRSVFHPPRHLMLIDKTKEKLEQTKNKPPESSEYYIAKLKGKKIKFIKKDGDEEDEDEGGSGFLDGDGSGGNEEEDKEYTVDKSKDLEEEPEEDQGNQLDRIADKLNERKENDNYKDVTVFDHHIEIIEHIKDNLRKIENIPINETDPLYLRFAEAMCGSLAEMNITQLDNDQDAYITGVLEFLDVVTSTNNRRTLLALNQERFPTLCKEAQQAIPNGFDAAPKQEHTMNKPKM